MFSRIKRAFKLYSWLEGALQWRCLSASPVISGVRPQHSRQKSRLPAVIQADNFADCAALRLLGNFGDDVGCVARAVRLQHFVAAHDPNDPRQAQGAVQPRSSPLKANPLGELLFPDSSPFHRQL